MPYNLLTYSEDFSQWSLTRAISTANAATSPDGTNNAYKLQSNTTGSNGSWYRQVISAFNGGHNLSVYAKKNSSDFLQLRIDGLGGVVFNLDTGVVKSQSSAVGSIEDVGNGWYRCSAQMTSSSSTTILLIVGNENMTPQNWSSTSGDSVYLWGAQVNSGTSAKTYFPTTTRLNMPRVDYLNNSNGSLILEPQSTNLVTYSSDFSEWYLFNATTTLNFATSPSGETNAVKITSSATYANVFITVSKSSSALNYTQSVFVKAVNYSIVNLISYGSSSSNRAQVSFDLSDGSVSTNAITSGSFANPSQSIENYGNGWYRCSLSFTSDTSSEVRPYIQFPIQMTNDNYVLLYGSQLENQSYPTTLINTIGSSVTRNADACSISNVADRIGQTEGTIYGEFDFKDHSTGTRRLLCLTDGTSSNRITTYINTLDKLSVYIVNGGAAQADIQATVLTEGTIKYALAYVNNSIKLYLNGTQVGTDTSATIPATSDFLVGFEHSGSSSYFNWRNCQIYSTALSDSELAALTT
jgi:hypothetical protein